MNKKITLPKAARLMADASGLTIRQCEDFLKGLTDIITESLTDAEPIKVKGLGTFRLTKVDARRSVDVTSGEPVEIAEHTKVVFVPCKELATEVNSPFDFFEAVELDDSVSEEELDAIGTDEGDEEGETTDEPEDVEEPLEEKNGLTSEDATEESIEEVAESSVEEVHIVKEEPQVPENSEPTENVPVKNKKRGGTLRFGRGFLIGFVVCLLAVAIGMGAAFVYMLQKYPGFGSSEEREEIVAVAVVESSSLEASQDQETTEPQKDSAPAVDRPAVTESADDVPTSESDSQKADEPVYDTISKTRYLTTMAKEHYGDFNLWPYIYEENKAILGHPDRIRPGTRVVIPPLSKYCSKVTPAEIEKAKRKGAEIYARYNK